MPTPQHYGLSQAAYDVRQTAALLSLGRTSLYNLVKSGNLKATKVGRKTLFLAIDIAACLGHLGEGGDR